MKLRWLFLLGIILGIGIGLRSIETLAGNFVFSFDQGLYFTDVRNFFEQGKLPLIGSYTPLIGIFQHPIFYWFLSIFYLIFSGNPYGGMVLMFLISITAIPFVFFLSRKMYDLKTAAIITLLFSFSYPVSHAARILWPPLPIYAITPFYLFFVASVLKGKNNYFPLVFLSLGLITAFEIAAGTILFLPTLALLFIFAKKSFSLRNLALAFFLNLLLFSPLLIFNFRHENIIFNGVLNFLKGTTSSGEILQFSQRISLHFEALLTSLLNSLTLITPFNLILSGIIIFLIAISLQKKLLKDKFYLFLILLPVFTYLEMLFFKSLIWQWYLIPFIVCYIFLFGLTLSKLVFSKYYLLGFMAFAFIVIFSIESGIRLYNSFKIEFGDYGGTSKIRGKIDAINYIYKSAKGEKFSLLIFSPPVYTYPYDYLLDSYAKKKFGYLPSKEKKGLVFLLIEKDPHQPWTYQGWLDTVVKGGKILENRTLYSGFIIQKREF